jgi:hypothetical protein
VFERVTERARQVVVLAQDEARALKHNYIGTEHILLGLVRENEPPPSSRRSRSPWKRHEEEGVAGRILLDFDADAARIHQTVLGMLSGLGQPEPAFRARLQAIEGRLAEIERRLETIERRLAAE